MAKPRVFVSSTYYDLKYVRERLERFFATYGMDPILFERDKVYYDPSLPPTESCYSEIETCHMFVLIVGGRYGSVPKEQASVPIESPSSVTQNEYERAKKLNLPTYIFVDKNVFVEYNFYCKNKDNNPEKLTFPNTDDIRIFEFISTFEKKAIKAFERIEDIENFLTNQLSGMLFKHLERIKNNQETQETQEIKTTVEEIQTVSNSMKEMLNAIGEQLLQSNGDNKYKKLVEKQRKDIIDLFYTIFRQGFSLSFTEPLEEESDEMAKYISDVILNNVFKNKDVLLDREIKLSSGKTLRIAPLSYSSIKKECIKQTQEKYEKIDIDIKIGVFRKSLLQVIEILKEQNSLNKYFEEQLYHTIKGIIDINNITNKHTRKVVSSLQE